MKQRIVHMRTGVREARRNSGCEGVGGHQATDQTPATQWGGDDFVNEAGAGGGGVQTLKAAGRTIVG